MKVNKLSLKQTGGQAQTQAQAIDPAIQQITEFITSSLDEGQEPVSIVMSLAEQEVDQQIIAQAFMTMGYEEADVIGLFEEVQKQLQPPGPSSPEQQTQNPQEIARNESLIAEAQQAEAQQEQAAIAQQDAMSQQLQAKSGIEIKPENKGKFTAWAKANGMSVSEASNKVMGDTESYSPSVVKMANFAKNAAEWKKEEGGDVSNYTEGVRQREGSYNPPNRKYTLDPRFKQEGGEFTPHFMYKDGNTQKAETYAEHLKLKGMGYGHENNMTKAKAGVEQGSVKGNVYDTLNIKDTFTLAPNYVNPIAFESNNNFSIGDAASVLVGGYNDLLNVSEDGNGIREGSFLDWRKKNALDKENSMIATNEKGQTIPAMTTTPAVDTVEVKYGGSLDKTKYGQEIMQYLKNGGSLPKAQFLGEWDPQKGFQQELMQPTAELADGPLSMKDWLLEDSVRRTGPNAQGEYNDYLNSFNGSGVEVGANTVFGPPESPVESFAMREQEEIMDIDIKGLGPEGLVSKPSTNQSTNSGGNYGSNIMNAFGDVSNFAVQGAGVINDWFRDKKVNDAIADNRNNLVADKIYGVNEDPFMKRGSWDTNTGTFGSEGQRTVSTNWGMAQKGKEIKAYNDFKSYLEQTRQAIGTNDKEKLRSFGSLNKSYNTNDLSIDYAKAQKLRKDAGLGILEEADLTFPHVGQQIRGTLNDWMGTHYKQGGETIDVDSTLLAKLIAAGADIEIL